MEGGKERLLKNLRRESNERSSVGVCVAGKGLVLF